MEEKRKMKQHKGSGQQLRSIHYDIKFDVARFKSNSYTDKLTHEMEHRYLVRLIIQVCPSSM